MMKILKGILSRITFILIAIVIEAYITIHIFRWFGENAAWLETLIRLISVIVVLMINKNSKHLSSDIIWIVIIVALPVPGTILYFALGANLITSDTYKSLQASTLDAQKYYVQNKTVYKELSDDYLGQVNYISKSAGFPFYRNTGFDYYELGEVGFPIMLEELKKAKKFIFIEYFIIEEGIMWDQILQVLQEKVKEGVDVRVMYDDLGSFFTLSVSYANKLEKMGIKALPFNRVNPIIGIIMNHRDHRKIMVIDGKVAFSGGINLADEYINVKIKHGQWKDNCIRVTGQAVWSYTVMFLTHWNALRKEDESFLPFKVNSNSKDYDGYIAPYGQTPFGGELIAQNIYINILNQAKKYCYIFTPYLIIDQEMINSLVLAAKRGVDVRIVTPGIPDKKIVYSITRSYYKVLLEGGVKIFEYSPGFLHSKVFVCDDVVATVGTVNLDYRSLYLHFENGTYLYKSSKILDIKKDVTNTMKKSHQVKIEELPNGIIRSFLLSILRLFAPMM